MPGRARPIKCSSSRLMRIITGALSFFDSSAGITSVSAPVILLPNPPPVYSLMKTILSSSMCIQRAMAGSGLKSALRSCVQKELAVLPVSHRGARLQALVAHIRRQKRLVEHQRCVLESPVHIAVRPRFGRMAHRHTAFLFRRKILVRPLQFRQLFRPAAPLRPHPDVPFLARILASRAQALQRIGRKRQRLHVDLDLLDRFRAGQLIHGRDRQNRFALVHRLVRQRQFAPFVGLDSWSRCRSYSPRGREHPPA